MKNVIKCNRLRKNQVAYLKTNNFQITVRKGLFFATSLRVNSRLFVKSSNLSVGRQGEQYKEMNLNGLFVINP